MGPLYFMFFGTFGLLGVLGLLSIHDQTPDQLTTAVNWCAAMGTLIFIGTMATMAFRRIGVFVATICVAAFCSWMGLRPLMEADIGIAGFLAGMCGPFLAMGIGAVFFGAIDMLTSGSTR